MVFVAELGQRDLPCFGGLHVLAAVFVTLRDLIAGHLRVIVLRSLGYLTEEFDRVEFVIQLEPLHTGR